MRTQGILVPVLVMLVITPGNWCHSDGETFTSSAVMQELLTQESHLVERINVYLAEEEGRLREIRQKLKMITDESIRSANREDVPEFMGHPINAYNTLKKWYDITARLRSQSNWESLDKDLRQNLVPLPREADVKGAQEALLRLQRMYQLDTTLLANGSVYGRQAETPLTASDFFQIGVVALETTLDHDLAAQWFQKAVEVETPKESYSRVDAWLKLANAHKEMGNHDMAVQAAMQASELDPDHRTSRRTLERLRLQRQTALDEGKYVPHDNSTAWNWKKPYSVWRYADLCRGPIPTKAEYSCRYKRGSLIPYHLYKEETLSSHPKIVMFYDVISDDEADDIRKRAFPKMKRALVGSPVDHAPSSDRISKVGWLWDEAGRHKAEGDIIRLTRRVQDITGLETEYKYHQSNAEPFQVVNYGLGGQYDPHFDYYQSEAALRSLPVYIKGTGDRVATFLFYLNDIQAGGATVFPVAKVHVPPVKNAAAFWYNIRRSGHKDSRSKHAGCPVLLGEKWVANKWIRENGQVFRRPCGLRVYDADD